MNSNFFRLVTAVAALFFLTCSTAFAWDRNMGQVPIPGGLTADTLPDARSTGARLYAAYCSQCHNLPSPRMHAKTDWPKHFEKMLDHVKLLAGVDSDIKMPAGNDKQEIISYLQSNGFIGLAEYGPLLTEPEGFNVAWYCSACHAVPDPIQFPAKGATQLSAKEWHLVVDRMNTYRKNQGREMLSDADKELVVKFLTKKRK
jgi:mono/diheme cytochrome c family protein